MQDYQVISSVTRLMETGYGYIQLLNKLNLTENELIDVCDKHPSFKHIIEKKYKITLNTKVEESSNVSDGSKENGRKSKRNTK